MKKRLSMIALALLFAVSAPAQALASGLGDFSDTPKSEHWSYKGLEYAVNQGFIQGDNGKLMPESSLTRSQLAAIINRIFNSSEKASLSKFTDIKQDAWYVDDMAKALKMGTLTGRSENEMSPNAKVSRQEVFVIFSRLLSASNDDTQNLMLYSDSMDIGEWAKAGISALIERNIISGSGNKINPLGTMSRQEFATILLKSFPNVVRSQEDLKNLVSGNTLIVSPVEIKDVNFKGDLIMADGIKSKIKIEDSKIEGNLLIRGGDLEFKNLSIAKETIISNPNGKVNISGDKMARINAKTPVVLKEGQFGTVTGKEVIVEKATVQKGEFIKKETEKAKEKKGTDKKESSRSGSSDRGSSSSNLSTPSEKILYGDANIDQRKYPSVAPFVHPPFFNAKVKVTLGTDGRIKKVEDDATEAGRNKRFWDMSTNAGLFEKFTGKTLEEVKAMKMDKNEADSISGATANSLAVQEAVINAIIGKKGKEFLKNEETLTAKPLIVDSGTTEIKFENTLPQGFDIELVGVSYSIYNTEEPVQDVKLSEDGTTLTVPKNLKPGHYYVNIRDKSEKYRSPDFETGHGATRHYPYFIVRNTAKLSFEDETLKVSSGTLEDVFKNIEHIIIQEKSSENKEGEQKPKPIEIEPVGHHGTKGRYSGETLFGKDGKIKPNAKIGRRVPQLLFTRGKEYDIEIQVWGFEEPLKFSYLADKTNELLEGDANVDQRSYPVIAPFIHPPFYNVRVKVELDSEGKIVAVTDNETATKGWDPSSTQENWNRKNKPYWDKTINNKVLEKFAGMTLEKVKAMNIKEIDAVSGATENGYAIQEAIINAIEKRAGKKFLEDGKTLKPQQAMVDSTTREIQFVNTLPEDFDLELVNVVHTIYNSAETTTSPAILGAVLSEDGTSLIVKDNLEPGHYYVNIKDKSQKYRSPNFEVRGDNRNYPYFVVKNTADVRFEDNKLVTSDGNLKNILNNIKEIIVKEKDSEDKPVEIEIIGHHGTVSENAKKFFNEEGEINKDAKVGKQNKAVFESGKTYEIEVYVWGLEDAVKTQYKAGYVNIVPQPEEPKPTTKEKFGEYNTEGFNYIAKVKVILSAEDKIISVEDNGTNPVSKDDSTFYWNKFKNEGGFEKYKGKSKTEVEDMKVNKGEVDCIGGATVSSQTVKNAILNAFSN